MSGGWIGVDFDGTLAKYDGWQDGKLGAPVPAMVERVKKWIAEGREVRIVTARVGNTGLPAPGGIDDHTFAMQQARLIGEWCQEHIGMPLIVTASKDFGMVELWDDRAVQVRMNTGEPVGFSTRGL